MACIQWGVDFYTGLPDVDQQHNKLVALANRLCEAAKHDPELLSQAFEALKDYVVEHFSLEERLMDEAGIDSDHIRYHKHAHALFVAKVAELWEGRNDDEGDTLNEMLAFLTTWILQHILHTDREMASAIHTTLGTEAPHNMFTHY
ncbi:MAG: hemerythrin family protein [Thiobacillus sp.]|nr:hemerythrin family protein [Thiobacillus sp.]